MASFKRQTTKSTLGLAKTAYELGQRTLPAYSSDFSPQLYTQAQLFALLVLRQFLRRDYRGLSQMLAEWSDLREVLELKRVPHYTTLQKAAARLLKKSAPNDSSIASFVMRASAAGFVDAATLPSTRRDSSPAISVATS